MSNTWLLAELVLPQPRRFTRRFFQLPSAKQTRIYRETRPLPTLLVVGEGESGGKPSGVSQLVDFDLREGGDSDSALFYSAWNSKHLEV